MAETVAVALGPHAYEIRIGGGLLDSAGPEIGRVADRRRLILLVDGNVARLHQDRLAASLRQSGWNIETVLIEPGEASKDVARLPALAEQVLALRPDRRTVLVAFGGGVVGDLCGFLASILLRGLDFIQVPTTLLAQIDSSVGGKTGVNSRYGKNLVGAFLQPLLVLADTDLLATLPRRELLAGYAEMVKYAALGDAAFFASLEAHGPEILALQPEPLTAAIAHCCRMKAAIVAADEREAGERALLNLGHTFGHALEAETGMGETLLHGEAVALGMVLAAQLSHRLGRLPEADMRRLRDHLSTIGLRTRLREVPGHPFCTDRLIHHMAHDKKATRDGVAHILLDRLGSAAVVPSVPEAAVRATLDAAA